MECKFCGGEMPENGKFCPYCGLDNADVEETMPEELTETEPKQAVAGEKSAQKENKEKKVHKTANKRKVGKVLTISGCIALMLVLAMVLTVVISANNKDSAVYKTYVSAKESVVNLFNVKDWELFRDNDINKKDSYTVSDKKAAKKADTVVATLGDAELTNGQLRVYYWMQFYSFVNYYGYYLSLMGLDYTEPLDEQYCTDELTWQQYFIEEALASWHAYQALYDAAMEQGFELSEESREELDQMEEYFTEVATNNDYDSLNAMIEAEFGAGVTFDDYMFYIERYYVGNEFADYLEANTEASEEEMEIYFQENEETLAESGITKDSGLLVSYYQIMLTPVTTEDEEGNTIITDEAWETCYSNATSLLQKYLDGEKTADRFVSIGQEAEEDETLNATAGSASQTSNMTTTTVDVRHILILASGTENEDGSITFSDEDAAAEAYAKAEEILNKWLEDPTEENFATLANNYSEDNGGDVTTGGLYEDVTVGQMVSQFEDWCFDEDRQEGDYGIVATKYGYHIMYLSHQDGDAEQWLYDTDREAGDTTVVKTDDGYAVLYYVIGEEGWIIYCRSGVITEKCTELMTEYATAEDLEVTYGNICLGAVDFS